MTPTWSIVIGVHAICASYALLFTLFIAVVAASTVMTVLGVVWARRTRVRERA